MAFNFNKNTIIFFILFIQSCGDGGYLLYGTGTCGGYSNSEESLYILPYYVGELYMVSQGNCSNFSHKGTSRYSYDFSMPINTSIHASRAGVVAGVKEDEEDGNQGTSANYIMIRHSDNSVAIYAHLTYQGSTVKTNDLVEQGELIGYSGNTGYSTGPHLHFEIFDYVQGTSLPVNFRNTSANPEGLKENTYYRALPFEASNDSIDFDTEISEYQESEMVRKASSIR